MDSVLQFREFHCPSKKASDGAYDEENAIESLTAQTQLLQSLAEKLQKLTTTIGQHKAVLEDKYIHLSRLRESCKTFTSMCFREVHDPTHFLKFTKDREKLLLQEEKQQNDGTSDASKSSKENGVVRKLQPLESFLNLSIPMNEADDKTESC